MTTTIVNGNLRSIVQKVESMRSWIKGNKELFTLVGMIVGASMWMTNGLHNLERDLTKEITSVKEEVTCVREELVKIETVLILKGIAPAELFSNNDG